MSDDAETPSSKEVLEYLKESLKLSLREAYGNREFVEDFDRLYGTNLARRGAPIELMVDEATGRMESDARQFYEFVRDYVWRPVFLARPKENGA